MSILDDIYARFDKDNPVINKEVGGESVEITGAERDALIRQWAENAHSSAFARIRAERDALLIASDWTQNPDAPVDAAVWAKYRQALRDLPAKIKDPTAEVNWPEPPK